uniref:Zinc finger, CCHC-type n=1 Tax=Tanacetum cinerariifolium TaxID=118510 RepID=A0A699HZ62_TANCI|nr:hypothetical protein [Tanacetum cinerariifolium]
MSSKLLNSCEPARPVDTNAALKVRLCAMTNTQTPPSMTTVVNTTGEPVTKTVANYAERLEKFNGQNFKRWQQKMFFYLTTLGLARFLKETVPQVEPPTKGMTLSETFQAVAIIEKLPPSWVDFKNYLKHKRKEMSVKDLVVRLRIKEGKRLGEKDTYTPDSAKPSMIEHVGSSLRSNPKGKGKDKRKNDKKRKGKSKYLAPKAGIVKQKFQGTCYNCDQPGHRAANYMMPKRVNPRHENMVNDDVDIIMMVSNVCAMIYEGLCHECSSRLDDEVFHDKRQQDENDLQVERQDQVEEVRNRLDPILFLLWCKMNQRLTEKRMILAIAALRNLKVHQMDMKTAFLNGDLEEEIYMNQPEGFIAPGQEGKVYRLVKSLYGLKQAPK